MTAIPDGLRLQGVTVLLKVDHPDELIAVGGIATDPAYCGRTQIGMGLIQLGDQFIESAQRAEGRT